MDNNIFCSQKGHEHVQTTHLCTFEGCKLFQRQRCIYCINEGIHNQGKADQEHIKLEQIPQVQNDKNIKPIDLSKREYKVKEIDQDSNCLVADISNNEKYLAYGGFNRILTIYDLKQDRTIKEFKINGRIQAIQFSFDSSKLYVAFRNNKLHIIIGFDVEKNFKKIFGQCVITNKYRIETIITIQKHYLITCDYGQIIKIDIKRNKQIVKLIDDISAIDYNQYYDMIITGCQNGSIKLWDFGKRSVIINKKQSHNEEIYQIQFINNIQNVLSLDSNYNLYKWSVDIINKKLIKLQEYQDPNGIQNFCSINQNQNLLLICGCYVKIVDDKGQTIKQINHLRNHYYYPERKRNIYLDNAKYIYLVTISNVESKYAIILMSTLE